VIAWLIGRDIAVITEIHCQRAPPVTGFLLLENCKGERGGVAVYVKDWLATTVCDVDTSCDDQVWFSLSIFPRRRFGGMYIPPMNSDYYDPSQFAMLEAQFMRFRGCSLVVVGDQNARLGKLLKELELQDGSTYECEDGESNHEPAREGNDADFQEYGSRAVEWEEWATR